MLRPARFGVVVMGLFTISLVLLNGCQQQQTPLEGPAAFREIVKEMHTLFTVQPAAQKLLVIDPVKGDSVSGYEAKITGNGQVLKDAPLKVDSLKRLLTVKGWVEDIMYAADGPQGSFAAFRQGNDLCIVSYEWAPAEGVSVPDDQPLMPENLVPEQRIYTIIVQYAPMIMKAVEEASLPAGIWVVNSYKLGNISALSEEEATAMLNKEASIDSGKITFDGNECPVTKIGEQEFQINEYLEPQYKITAEFLNISSPTIKVFTTDCTLAGFSEFIQLEDGSLVIDTDGVFFMLEKK